MLSQFFYVQWEHPTKYDWTETVKQDLVKLDINLTLCEIQKMKKETFADLVKRKVKTLALQDLLLMKASHSKMSNVNYKELKLQDIYKSENINSFRAKNLYRWRTRMWEFRNNYRGKYSDLKCPLCKNHIDKDEFGVASVVSNY